MENRNMGKMSHFAKSTLWLFCAFGALTGSRIAFAQAPGSVTEINITASSVTVPIGTAAVLSASCDGGKPMPINETVVGGATYAWIVTAPATATITNTNAQAPTISFTSSAAGTFPIGLTCTVSYTVVDAQGNTGTIYGTSQTVTVNIYDIGGPITGNVSDVRYYHDGTAPTKSLSAASGQPSGVAYSWAVTSGSNELAIVGSSTSTNATVKGTAPSGLPHDVTVTLTYSLNGISAPASQQLTVRTPTYIEEENTTPASEFHYGDISNPLDKAYGYSFGGNFNSTYDQQTLWALQDQFSSGMDNCTVGETWNYPQQAADNHSVYGTPDGKWNPGANSTWNTLANGVFDATDHFATFRNGRDSADPTNFHFLADFNKTHDIGSATHEFHAYTPNQAGPILLPTFLTTYYADHAAWTLSY